MKIVTITGKATDGSITVYSLSNGETVRIETASVEECGLGVMMRVYGYDIGPPTGTTKPADPSRVPIFQNGDQVGTLPFNHPGNASLFQTFEGWIASPTCNVSAIEGFED